MTGLWLLSYVILWLLLIATGLVILALAREIEALHTRLDSLYHLLDKVHTGTEGQSSPQDIQQTVPQNSSDARLHGTEQVHNSPENQKFSI